MHDSASASVSRRSREQRRHHLGQLAAVLAVDAAGQQARGCPTASASMRASASASDAPSRREVQLDLSGAAQDGGAGVLERLVERAPRPARRRSPPIDAILSDARREHAPAGALAHDRQHLLVEHRLHLAGRPGQQEQQAAVRARSLLARARCRAGWAATTPPSMRSACFSLTGAITRPKRAKRALSASSRIAGSRRSARPAARAAASRVRSSSVGPRPPVAITTSARDERLAERRLQPGRRRRPR